MRKRPMILAAAAAVAGLAVLGTVVAQQPGGTYPQTKVAPASGPFPATTVRPYGEWSPNSPQPVSPAAGLGMGNAPNTGTNPNATRPAGGVYPAAPGQPQPAGYTPNNRPRPGVAGGDPVRPAGAFDVPPPSMEFPGVNAPAKPLAPPSLSVEPGDNKFAPPASPAGATPPPYVPVPPAPSGTVPPPSFPAPTGPEGRVPPPLPVPPVTAPKPLPGSIGNTGPIAPPTVPAAPTAPAATIPSAALPGRVAQSVSVEAACPESVVFNTPAEYTIVVRNTGSVAVQNVRVEDEIPAGCKYIGSDPPAELNGDRLVWALGALDGSTDKRFVVRVRPTEEGEFRSRATVTFSAAVDAKTKVTRPRIAVAVTCPEVARAGEEPVFKIRVTNSGTGPAQKMVLQAQFSEGLDFRNQPPQPDNQRTRVQTELANLPAGESRTIDLPLSALKSGLQTCQVTVTAEGSPEATAKASVNVVEPMLQLTQTGPAKCLVRAEPTYEITLSNPGTAATDPVTVHAVLPDGFDFVQASDAGTFNATNRAVTWKLQGLTVGGTKAVAVKLRAGVAGDVLLRTVAIAAPDAQPAGGVGTGPGAPGAEKVVPAGRQGRVLEAKADTPIKAEGVSALRFEVAGLENPVEVGKEAIYEIRVVNQGTGACTNVQIAAVLADGTTYSSSTGPTTGKATGQTLVFEPLATLPVKGETVYRVRVRGNAAGDQRFRVHLTCDQVRTPVSKEESTRFYQDK